jgi:hypothetical protein
MSLVIARSAFVPSWALGECLCAPTLALVWIAPAFVDGIRLSAMLAREQLRRPHSVASNSVA